MVDIKRPALRYFGGKWRLAPWIISNFGEHTTYVEPYCGAASVFLRKEPSPIEVINDMDDDVVNFFRVLREQPDELVPLIQFPPFSRKKFQLAFQPAERSPLEKARAFYIRCWQAYGGRRSSMTGWRTGRRGQNKKASVVRDWNNTDHLFTIANRLKDAHIEHSPALDVIKKYDGPETLFYVDPPYPRTVRSERWSTEAYRHEMTDRDHEDLAALLHTLQGKVIVSTIACPLYDHLFEGWGRKTKGAYTGMGAGGHGRQYDELLLISPETKPVRNDLGMQKVML